MKENKMPNFDLARQPQYPIKTLDTDKIIPPSQIASLLSDCQQITLCVRSKNGHPNRGGYYFCISEKSANTYDLETIEGVYVDTFSLDDLTILINHASGKKFSQQMLDYCQNSINFRAD